MSEQHITKKDLNKVLLRSQLIQMSHNYERMQSLGTLYCLNPILKKLYKDKPKEEKIASMKRHLEFFNSHPVTIPFILGVTTAMEENTGEEEKDSVISLKTSLMGPLAGLGDSLLNFTWMPICGSVGAAFAIQGNIMGPILMFILVNLLYWPLKYYGLNIGYTKGREILSSGEGKGILDRLANMANVLGVMVSGGLIATTIKLKLAVKFAAGAKPLVLQDMIDKVMPNLLPLAITLICFYLLKKWNGKHAVAIIFGVLIVAVLLSMCGILA